MSEPKRIPLSVFIIAKNEVDRLPRVIQSVIHWVDEVLVIDCGSTDDTVKVSEDLGARVIYNAWKGYGAQKIFGQQQCKHNWILNIDADEEVSDALKEEIIALFKHHIVDQYVGYRIRITLMMPMQKKISMLAPYDRKIRLYHRQKAGFRDSTIHDDVVLHDSQNPVASLKGLVYHRCFRSYAHAIDKINHYSSMQAEHMIEKGRVPSRWRMVTEPFLAFMKAYIIRRYIVFGVSGFIESVIYMFAKTIRLAKARELSQKCE